MRRYQKSMSVLVTVVFSVSTFTALAAPLSRNGLLTQIPPDISHEDRRITELQAALKLEENMIFQTELAMLKHKKGGALNENANFLPETGRLMFSALQYDQTLSDLSPVRGSFDGSLDILTGDRAIDESLQLGSVGIDRNDPQQFLLESMKGKIEAYKIRRGLYPETLAELSNGLEPYDQFIFYNGSSRGLSTLIDTFDYQKTGESYALKLKDEGKDFTLKDIIPLEIKSHPWDKMLEGKTVQNLEIAKLVPNDTLFLYFNKWGDFDKLDAVLQETIEPVKGITGIDTSLSIGQALSERLGIHASQAVKDQEIVVIAEDFDFMHDNSLAVLIKKPGGNTGESQNFFLPKEGVKSGMMGDYFLVSNSAPLWEKIQKTFQNDAGSMYRAKDFQYTLSVLDPRREGMLYFSENLIRKLTGPQYRIALERRNTIVHALIQLQYVAFAYRDFTGVWPTSLNQIGSEGYIRLDTIKEVEKYRIDEKGIVYHADWGSLYDLNPVENLEIKNITSAEKHRYDNFKEGYQQYWREFIDPIGIGITLGDRIMIHTIILPLIEESQYNWLKDIFGGAPASFDFVNKPDRNAALQFIGKWDFDQLLYTLQKESEKYSLGPEDEQRRADLSQLDTAINRFIASEGRLPACKNQTAYCTFSDNTDGLQNEDYAKMNLEKKPLDPEDSLPYWYARLPNGNDFIVFGQSSDDKTEESWFGEKYNGFLIMGSQADNKDFFASLGVTRRSRKAVTELSEADKRTRVIQRAKDQIKKELGITTEGDVLDFMSNEIMLGIGEKNEFEIDNIQNLDIWIGVELKDQQKAKDFMSAVWRKFSADRSGRNSLDPLSNVPLSPFGLFDISSESPLKNEYNQTEYYILPTGFVNVYYFYLNNRMYITVSQAALNRIIDESLTNKAQKLPSKLQRSIDYTGDKHNIMALADLTNLQTWTRQLLDTSDFWLYEKFMDQKAYLREALTLSKILPNDKGNLSNVSMYFKNIPATLLSGKYEIKDGSAFLVTKDQSYQIDSIQPLRSYYARQTGVTSPGPDFDEIAKTLKENFNLDETLKKFTTFALGFSFLEDGLDIRLAFDNPAQAQEDSRFGPGVPAMPNTMEPQALWVKAVAGLLMVIVGIGILLFITGMRQKTK